MPFAQSDSQQIYWEERGPADAPTLLLVMGLGLSARSWDELPGRLESRFRVIVFDNRGTGRSTGPKRLFRMRALADDAAAVLRAAGVSEERPAFVFGISLGGMIAQELALLYPRLVKKLALGATNMGPRKSAYATPLAMAQFLALITLGPGREARRLARLCVSPGFAERASADWLRWARGLDPAGAASSLRQLCAVLGHSTHARLPALRAPTLVLTGDRDAIIPADNSRRIAALVPDARLVVIEGVGHVFPLEAPQRTVAELTAHFA
jgi:pimeloyl-ACP methyl ester carboxylesterase